MRIQSKHTTKQLLQPNMKKKKKKKNRVIKEKRSNFPLRVKKDKNHKNSLVQ